MTETGGSREATPYYVSHSLVQVRFEACYDHTVRRVLRRVLGDWARQEMEKGDGGGLACCEN